MRNEPLDDAAELPLNFVLIFAYFVFEFLYISFSVDSTHSPKLLLIAIHPSLVLLYLNFVDVLKLNLVSAPIELSEIFVVGKRKHPLGAVQSFGAPFETISESDDFHY